MATFIGLIMNSKCQQTLKQISKPDLLLGVRLRLSYTPVQYVQPTFPYLAAKMSNNYLNY